MSSSLTLPFSAYLKVFIKMHFYPKVSFYSSAIFGNPTKRMHDGIGPPEAWVEVEVGRLTVKAEVKRLLRILFHYVFTLNF